MLIKANIIKRVLKILKFKIKLKINKKITKKLKYFNKVN